MNRSLLPSLLAAALTAACADAPQQGVLSPVGPTFAASPTGELPSTLGFRRAVKLANIQAHLTALQGIANANGGTRHSTSAGHDASVQYVRQALLAAGYQVSVQTFPVNVAADQTPPVLEVVTPAPQVFIPRTDFATMSYSGSGDVTATVTPVDLVLPQPAASNVSTSGCEAADFTGFPAGNIALLQRGTCTFALKVQNAVAAGAVGAIIFNDGLPGRTGIIGGTLSAPQKTIPVVSTTTVVGQTLAAYVNPVVRVRVDFIVGTFNSANVIAESALGNASDVVVVGAALDSDRSGPGINAATGAAAQLEIARALSLDRTPRNRVRFVWFGGFHEGLVGSSAYVASLSSAELARVRAMLLLAPIGSPNYVRSVFDGDNSTFAAGVSAIAGPAGSGELERLFTDYFSGSALAAQPAALTGGADYVPFALAGVAVGGVFTGAQGVKTAAEAAAFGGTAGIAYDPCHLQACDTFANVSLSVLDEMSDAGAHATWVLARRNFAKVP